MDSQYDEAGGVQQRIEFSPSLTGSAEVLQFTKYYGNPSIGSPGARDTMTDAIATTVSLPADVTHYRSASPIPIFDVQTTNQHGDYPRENMIDGMIGGEDHGFWAGTPTAIQTIVANTGKERAVQAVVIEPRQGFGPKNATVSVSSDGTSYTDVWNGTLPNQRKVVYFDRPMRAQFVKLYVTSSYAPDGTVQIRELQLYGPESEDDSKRIAPVSSTASSQGLAPPYRTSTICGRKRPGAAGLIRPSRRLSRSSTIWARTIASTGSKFSLCRMKDRRISTSCCPRTAAATASRIRRQARTADSCIRSSRPRRVTSS